MDDKLEDRAHWLNRYFLQSLTRRERIIKRETTNMTQIMQRAIG